MTLTDTQLERLADLIAERVSERLLDQSRESLDPMQARGPAVPLGRRLVNAGELAQALGTSRRFVYEHSESLGAIRLGDGPKAPLRFDLEAAKSAMSCSAGRESSERIASDDGESKPQRTRRRRRVPNGLPKPGSVLQIRGAA